MIARFTQSETGIILDWFDTATSSSGKHLSGAQVLFPSELSLFKNLSNTQDTVDLIGSEVQLLYDIMQKSISLKYGNATYLFGFEQHLYVKINNYIDEFQKEESRKNDQQQ